MTILTLNIIALFSLPLEVPTKATSFLWVIPIGLTISMVCKALKMEEIKLWPFVREVMLLFSSEATAQQVAVPAFLTLDRRFGRRWHGQLTGPPSALIQWAAAQALEDVEIGPPSLESLFRTYYRVPEEAA